MKQSILFAFVCLLVLVYGILAGWGLFCMVHHFGGKL